MRPSAWMLLGPCSAALAALLGVFEPLDRATADAHERLMSAQPISDRVRIVVAADEDEALLEHWPWDRRVHAQMLECLREAGARCICFDILFDGPGRDAEGDALFLDRLKATPGTVLGVALEMERSRGTLEVDRERFVGHSLAAPRDSRFPLTSVALLPVADLGAAAGRLGFLNAPTDPDGKVRHAWLLLEYEGRLVPSLPLAALLAAHRAPLDSLDVSSPGTLRFRPPEGEPFDVPLDRAARLRLDGTLEVRDGAVRSYSDVFRVYSEGGAAALSDYKDRVVLVGNVMTGSGDVVSTSRHARIQGLFVQAQALSQLLERHVVREASREVGALLALLFGALGALGAYLSPRLLRALSGPTLALALLATTFLLRAQAGWVIPASASVLAVLLGWGGASLGRLIEGTRRRRELETLFGSLLPPETLARAVADGGALLRRTERHEVAMLSARLGGWESAGLASEEETRLLEDVASVVAKSIHGEQGALLRCSFDRVFAIFGHPQPLEDPVRAAVDASARLSARLSTLNAAWADRLGAPLTLGIGLHVGVVTVGFVGTAAHREYAAYGFEVARADALATRAGGVRVLASERLKARAPTAVEAVLLDRDDRLGSVYELVLPTPPASPV